MEATVPATDDPTDPIPAKNDLTNPIPATDDQAQAQINSNLRNCESEMIESLLKRDGEEEGMTAEEYLYLDKTMQEEAKKRFPGKFGTCTFQLGICEFFRKH